MHLILQISLSPYYLQNLGLSFEKEKDFVLPLYRLTVLSKLHPTSMSPVNTRGYLCDYTLSISKTLRWNTIDME